MAASSHPPAPDAIRIARLADELNVGLTTNDAKSLATDFKNLCGCPPRQPCKSCKRLLRIRDEQLIPRLAKRIKPFARGALIRWGTKILHVRPLQPWLTHATIQHAHWCAHILWHGTCSCPRERMRREKECGVEHSLRAWETAQTLDEFLIKVVVGFPFTNIYARYGAKVKLGYRAAAKVNSARRGMLAGQVLTDDNVLIVVGYIAKCWKCGDEVGPDNHCACRGQSHWPQVPDIERIFYAQGERSVVDEETRTVVGQMFRCQKCRLDGSVSKRKVKDNRLLFFPVGHSRSCPCCGGPLNGQSTTVMVRRIDLIEMRQFDARMMPKVPDDEAEPDVNCSSDGGAGSDCASHQIMQEVFNIEDSEIIDKFLSRMSSFRDQFSRTRNWEAINAAIDALEDWLRVRLEPSGGDAEHLPVRHSEALDALRGAFEELRIVKRDRTFFEKLTKYCNHLGL